MEARTMPTGVAILKWYFIILGIISVAMSLILPPIILPLVLTSLEATEELCAVGAFIGVATALWALFGIGYGIFQILIGIHLGKGRGWARIAALVVGILSILNMPVGTVLGILCLVFLLGEECKAYFQT